jgi:TonB-dependent SusC/RagA subfamily outer membrane receptor
MRIASLATAITLLTIATACASERAVAPEAQPTAHTSSFSANPLQVPLLFVVDGVRYAQNQVPTIDPALIASVTVLKGHAALKAYGPDASYGVVVVTTKQAATPQS